MGLKEYIRINRHRAIFIFLAITVTQGMTTLYTYLTSPQLDAISKGKFTIFLELLLLQFICGQICNVSFNLSSIQNTKQTQAIFHQARKQILKHYYQKSTVKVAEIENHLNNDLQILQRDYFDRLFYFTCNLIYILFTIGTLFTFHWLLVAYSLLITILAILIPKLLEKYTNKATERVSIQNSNFLNIIRNWFNGLAELRRFEKKFILKRIVGKESQKLEEKEFNRNKIMSYVTLIGGIFDSLGRVGVPLIAGILFYQHQVSLGAILTAGYFANGVFFTVNSTVNQYAELQSTKILRKKILKLQEKYQEEILDDIDAISKIEVENLAVKYRNGEEISYPNLSIKKGEKILLTGDSGSGKSTLLKTMLGEIKPKNGRVIYKNSKGEIIHPDLRQIGYLAQDLVMFPGSIQDNITMFNRELNNQVDIEIEKTAFLSDKKRFNAGLNTLIDPKNNLLSGGQRQKVVLARAFLHKKSVLFLDEATSAIDEKATTQIIRNLVNTNSTVIMIAHNLTATQKAFFDRKINLRGDK